MDLSRLRLCWEPPQLDLFSPLAKGPLTAAELAAQTGLPVRGVERLLNASAALGFVTREAERYRNAPAADAFLVKDKPGYVGNMLRQASDRYQAWGQAVRSHSERQAGPAPDRRRA